MEHLLEVKNLSVSIDGPAGEVQAVRDVSFSLKKGEVLAIVGESGCGKSVLCKSIMKLLPPSAKIKEGSICVNGQDITCYREREMQKLRGRVFAMIFQDPMTSLNPTIKIGKQIGEAVVIHNKNYTKEQVNKKVLELMELVGISHPKERYHQYPWQFSGGMRQRCVMAIALAADPDILFADEPTTALDVTERIHQCIRCPDVSFLGFMFWYSCMNAGIFLHQFPFHCLLKTVSKQLINISDGTGRYKFIFTCFI